MKYVAILYTTGLLLFGCKGGEPSTKTENARPEAEGNEAESKAEPPVKAAPVEEEAKVEPPVRTTFKAMAESADPAEGMPATFDLSLEVLENNTVKGSANVMGDTLTLSGTLAENVLRLWARGPDTGKLLGGYFVGEQKDGAASGIFALSGNGGAPALKGTWKTLK